ncbi:MAG: BBP7 family outer membrane beta-barrel protein [Gemmataceae bacterium]
MSKWARIAVMVVATWLGVGGASGSRAESPQEPWIHIGAEYLLWYSPQQKIPTPLVSTGAVTDSFPGAIGQPGTTILYGGPGTVDPSAMFQNGVRLTFGIGIDADALNALDGSFLLLANARGAKTFASDGGADSLLLARPFINLGTNGEDADPIAFPGTTSGQITISTLRQMLGGDLNWRYQYYSWGESRIALLFGGRCFVLDDTLTIAASSTLLPATDPTGTTFTFHERYRTHNVFCGGQVGAEYSLWVGPVEFLAAGKLAIGGTNESLTTNATSTVRNSAGLFLSSDRALYLAPGNIGRFSDTSFALMPEVNLKLALDVNRNLRFTVGYTYIALTQAARAAEQIDSRATPQVVGAPSTEGPAPATPDIHSRYFWAHGLDVGLRFSF